MPQPRSCPACARGGPFDPVETHRDRIGGANYELYRCPACFVVFSEPRAAVGPGWYEKSAPLRAREGRSDPRRDWRFRTFLNLPGKPGRVLDVGCGDGGFLSRAAAAGWSGVGFDYDARMVELAKRNGVDAHAMDFAAFVKTRAPGEFDAGTLFDVLEHTPEPAELLAQVRPLLKSGGRLVLTLPNALRPLPFGREEWDYPPHHFTRWSPAALRGFVERNGFVVERLDSGTLRLSYLSEQLFFGFFMPRVLSLYKRVAFGKTAAGKTVTEAYAASGGAGGLADPARRQDLVNGFKTAMKLVTYPLAAILWILYGVARPGAGEYIFLSARRRD